MRGAALMYPGNGLGRFWRLASFITRRSLSLAPLVLGMVLIHVREDHLQVKSSAL
jgi:hypothetical protein